MSTCLGKEPQPKVCLGTHLLRVINVDRRSTQTNLATSYQARRLAPGNEEYSSWGLESVPTKRLKIIFFKPPDSQFPCTNVQPKSR